MTRPAAPAVLLCLALCLTGPIPVASAASAQPQVACDEPPLALTDVEFYLRNFVPILRIRQKIAACGVVFILDGAGRERLRALGAPADLLDMLAPPATPAPGEVWTSVTDRREMAWIPPGTFTMGSPAGEERRDEDEAAHQVQVSGFWMDTTEVTNAAFRAFVLATPRWQKDNVDPATHDGGYLRHWTGNNFPEGEDDLPVVHVSWQAAAAYAAWTGKRLPTEAEWEYAARATASTAYWWAEAFDASRANNGPQLLGVGEARRRNAWRLADVIGNAAEWTASAYGPYPFETRDTAEGARSVRGGAWNQAPAFLRVANRVRMPATATSDQVGFRCAY